MRIPGVLQRIAVCYLLLPSYSEDEPRRRQSLRCSANSFWLLMTHVHAPGFATGDLSKEGSRLHTSIATVFGPAVWSQARFTIPKGILTDGALATTLFGF